MTLKTILLFLKKFGERATDHLINAPAFSDTPTTYFGIEGMIASWLTDRQTVFRDRNIAALLHIQKRLAVTGKKQTTQDHYCLSKLSRNARDWVLQGQTKLAGVEEINAIIWFSDLRGSTPFVGSIMKLEFLTRLNHYSVVTAGAMIANGGEILRFIIATALALFHINVDGISEHAAAETAAAALQGVEERLFHIHDTCITDSKPAISF